jgi:hypothetical protein
MVSNDNFKPISVGELLTGSLKFQIPSFQRGYRWDKKQVEDLIDDLKKFVLSNQKSYYLQPLVVRKIRDGVYEVLDGQQRLTTMLILLHVLYEKMDSDNKDYYKGKFYDVVYSNRQPIDFENLDKVDPNLGMDEFYVHMAWRIISKSVKNMVGDDTIYRTKITSAIFHKNEREQLVKFIWYVVDSSDDLNAIKIFNNLNKGKISLTSSELIKALFVLNREKKSKKCQISRNNSPEYESQLQKINLEWDQMEKRFEDDDFWTFISNNNPDIQTRIDVLFDFLTHKPIDNYDNDYSYRIFQKIFDKEESDTIPEELQGIDDFDILWQKVKEVYYRLEHWYEDVNLYNYIGFLVKYGKTPYEIYAYIADAKLKDNNWDINKTIKKLKELIKSTFGRNDTLDSIIELRYSNGSGDQRYLRMALLLFNIETYNRAGIRFPFAKYNEEGWDIEHIDSQKENNIVENEDRLRWLKFVIKALMMEKQTPENKDLLKTAISLGNALYEEGKDTNNNFPTFYHKIVYYYSDKMTSLNNEDDKHTIDNLALLDQATNRSYHNAPFPYKRFCIIERDKKGLFVPMCTKNLFLKYYSSSDMASSQLENMRWRDEDRRNYLAAIREVLGVFFN